MTAICWAPSSFICMRKGLQDLLLTYGNGTSACAIAVDAAGALGRVCTKGPQLSYSLCINGSYLSHHQHFQHGRKLQSMETSGCWCQCVIWQCLGSNSLESLLWWYSPASSPSKSTRWWLYTACSHHETVHLFNEAPDFILTRRAGEAGYHSSWQDANCSNIPKFPSRGHQYKASRK